MNGRMFRPTRKAIGGLVRFAVIGLAVVWILNGALALVAMPDQRALGACLFAAAGFLIGLQTGRSYADDVRSKREEADRG